MTRLLRVMARVLGLELLGRLSATWPGWLRTAISVLLLLMVDLWPVLLVW